MVRQKRLTESARQLRQRETAVEALLWEALRDRRLAGLKFRRQRPAGPFVLDFYYSEHKIVVELDGAIHDEQMAQDQARTELLQQQGYRLIRFRNEEMTTDLDGILARIRDLADRH